MTGDEEKRWREYAATPTASSPDRIEGIHAARELVAEIDRLRALWGNIGPDTFATWVRDRERERDTARAESDSLRAQLAEVTRERDEARDVAKAVLDAFDDDDVPPAECISWAFRGDKARADEAWIRLRNLLSQQHEANHG